MDGSLALTKSKVSKSSRGKGKSQRRGLPWFLWLAIALGIVAAVVAVRTSPANNTSTSSDELKAAIIDQLYNLGPNQGFIQQATQELEGYGFTVDVYHGDAVTVDLYCKLSTYGYKLIIFRAHSGILQRGEGSQAEVTDTTYLFTDEPYTRGKHIFKQLGDQIIMARMTEDYPRVFAVNSRFIQESMEGSFQNTVIIMMGCSTVYKADMADAFISKGASVFVGWSASVGLDYVDRATLSLINNLCGDMTVKQAVAKTMAQVGDDPVYATYLRYYPQEAGNRTIAELIQPQLEG